MSKWTKPFLWEAPCQPAVHLGAGLVSGPHLDLLSPSQVGRRLAVSTGIVHVLIRRRELRPCVFWPVLIRRREVERFRMAIATSRHGGARRPLVAKPENVRF